MWPSVAEERHSELREHAKDIKEWSTNDGYSVRRILRSGVPNEHVNA